MSEAVEHAGGERHLRRAPLVYYYILTGTLLPYLSGEGRAGRVSLLSGTLGER